MSEKRVVITGLGTVNALANNVEDTWNAILNRKSGITSIDSFDTTEYPSKISGVVKDFDITTAFKKESLAKAKKLDSFIHYAMAASKEAILSSGISETIQKNPHRIGVIIGSGIGGIKTHNDTSKNFHEKGPKWVSPFFVSSLIGNTACGFVSMEYGITGPVMAVQTACASANHSIGYAYSLIKQNLSDAIVCGGTEAAAIAPICIAAFSKMRALSTNFNTTPQLASRPFDKQRDGFVIADGAGIFVVEDYEHAKKRGANILCEIASVGMNADAYDLVSPHPEGVGVIACMKSTLAQASGGPIRPEEIDYINAHGTSTPLGDLAEANAIYQLVEGKCDNLQVSSTKSLTGHALGAASGIEAMICVMAIKDGKIPGNVNLDDLDENIKIPKSSLPTETLEKQPKVVLSNSFGFGGHNSTLALRKLS